MAINTLGISLTNATYNITGDLVANGNIRVATTATIVDSNNSGYELSFTDGAQASFIGNGGELPLGEYEVVSGLKSYTKDQMYTGKITLNEVGNPPVVIFKVKRDWTNLEMKLAVWVKVHDPVNVETTYLRLWLTPDQVTEGVSVNKIGTISKPPLEVTKITAIGDTDEVTVSLIKESYTPNSILTIATDTDKYQGVFNEPTASGSTVTIINKDLADAVRLSESTGAFSYDISLSSNATFMALLEDTVSIGGYKGATLLGEYANSDMSITLDGQGTLVGNLVSSVASANHTTLTSPWVVSNIEVVGVLIGEVDKVTLLMSPLSDSLTDFTKDPTGYNITTRVDNASKLVKLPASTVDQSGSLLEVVFNDLTLHTLLTESIGTFVELGLDLGIPSTVVTSQVIDGTKGVETSSGTTTTYTALDSKVGEDAHALFVDSPLEVNVAPLSAGGITSQIVEVLDTTPTLKIGLPNVKYRDKVELRFNSFTDDIVLSSKTILSDGSVTTDILKGKVSADGTTLVVDSESEPAKQVIALTKATCDGTYNGTYSPTVLSVTPYSEFDGNWELVVGKDLSGETVGFSLGDYGQLTNRLGNGLSLPYEYSLVKDGVEVVDSGVDEVSILSVTAGEVGPLVISLDDSYPLLRGTTLSFSREGIDVDNIVSVNIVEVTEVNEFLRDYWIGDIFAFNLTVGANPSLPYADNFATNETGLDAVTTYGKTGDSSRLYASLSCAATIDTFTLASKADTSIVYQLTTNLPGTNTVVSERGISEIAGKLVSFNSGLLGKAIETVPSYFKFEALPSGDNIITTGKSVDNELLGFSKDDYGSLLKSTILVDGKWDLNAEIVSLLTTLTGDVVLTLTTEAIEAVGRRLRLTFDEVSIEGTVVEVDGTTSITVDLGNSPEFLELASVEGNYIPFKIDLFDEVTLALSGVVLRGNAGENVFDKVASLGELKTDNQTTTIEVLNKVLKIVTVGTTSTITTSFAKGSVFRLNDIDAVSSTDDLYSLYGIVQEGGVVSFDDAVLAKFFSESSTNTVQFDLLVQEANASASYLVVLGKQGGDTLGYDKGGMGAINKTVVTGEVNRFSEDGSLHLTGLFAKGSSLVFNLEDTALEHIGRSVNLVTPMETYDAVLTQVDGVISADFGVGAAAEVMTYSEGYTLGVEINLNGTGNAYLDTSIARVGQDGAKLIAKRDKTFGYVIDESLL